MRIIGSLRALDDSRGAVRVEDVYDTDIDDLWDACTNPERLARWIAVVSGDLRPGGVVHAVYTSTWTGDARIEVCEPPRHLVISSDAGTPEETRLEVWLSEEGSGTRLVVEDRGLPLGELPFHGAGWQAHLDDLRRSLGDGAPVHPEGWSASAPSPDWKRRWDELTPAYRELEVG